MRLFTQKIFKNVPNKQVKIVCGKSYGFWDVTVRSILKTMDMGNLAVPTFLGREGRRILMGYL